MTGHPLRDTFKCGALLRDPLGYCVVVGDIEPYKLWTTDEDGVTNGEYSERRHLPIVRLPPRTDGIAEYLDESCFASYLRAASPMTAWRWPA